MRRVNGSLMSLLIMKCHSDAPLVQIGLVSNVLKHFTKYNVSSKCNFKKLNYPYQNYIQEVVNPKNLYKSKHRPTDVSISLAFPFIIF